MTGRDAIPNRDGARERQTGSGGAKPPTAALVPDGPGSRFPRPLSNTQISYTVTQEVNVFVRTMRCL
jgi:hypothetical protein